MFQLCGMGAEEAWTHATQAMFIFASVHTSKTTHAKHNHEWPVVGVFYPQLPNGSSPLILRDPRGLSPHSPDPNQKPLLPLSVL